MHSSYKHLQGASVNNAQSLRFERDIQEKTLSLLLQQGSAPFLYNNGRGPTFLTHSHSLKHGHYILLNTHQFIYIIIFVLCVCVCVFHYFFFIIMGHFAFLHYIVVKGGKRKKGIRIKKCWNANNIWCSQAVTHPSTNRTQRCLTSLIGREAVYSTWCGRWL